LLGGCAQTVLDPGINEATIRLLTRMGFDVVRAKGEGCCGALVHHMGRDEESHHFAKANIDAWMKEIDGEGLDAIAITTSGCGTTIKDYGFMFRNDPAYAEKAARISALAKDITEIISQFGLPEKINTTGQVIAYHSACSMQHGQQIKDEPKNLLKAAGFVVKDVPEGHICCGSAGTYNMMQPELSGALRERKVDHIERTRPEIVATGNLGCMTQIGKGLKDRQSDIRVVHTIELLDWATGGPLPRVLADPGFH
jgi:glycolate oxidase iron-sulfur subunit